VLAGLQASLTGQVRVAFADEIERAGEKDRREAAEHHRRQHLGEDVALGLIEDLRITDRERNGALAHPARHDRDHDEEEAVIGAEPEQRADRGADRRGGERTDRERHENLHEALDQDLAVHAQNAADDDASDEQIEEVGVFGELDDRLFNLRRQQLIISERRGHESRENRRRSDIAQHREPLADLGAGEAAHHQHGDHDGDFALDVAGVGEAREQREQDDVDRKRDDPDSGIHDPPPAVRPPRLRSAGSGGRMRRCGN
jgi:hypothetical protein